MTTQMADAVILDDRERLRLAEEKYAEVLARGLQLRPGPLAELISRETGVGSDAARLVVMAHHTD